MIDLNLNKPKNETTVLVAMSGGVDSSVVAVMLKKAGYNVVGATLQLYNATTVPEKSKTCCGIKDIHDARTVAAMFDIKHYVLDYESIFKQEVMEQFADDYLAGSTPVPCIRCNQSVKFRDLMKIAKDIKADAMVTGHYVQRKTVNGIAELHRAIDLTKDQSYFLFSTTQEQLDFLHFPLGGYNKTQVRQIARDLGVIISEKKDSQDICFVPDGDYVKVVQRLRPGTLEGGDIINIKTGEKLGSHLGLINYTIGQRKGIGIAGEKPFYVVKMDFTNHTLFIGEESDLYNTEFIIGELNLLPSDLVDNGEIEAEVCLRALQPLILAKIFLDSNEKTATIKLKNSGRAITRGQACVIYQNNRMIGGGFIRQIIDTKN